MKLYQQLEQTFKMRLNSNSEIIPYIKKLSEMGKFDEPKKIAAIAILLDRLGKMEDEADMEKLLHGASSGAGGIESEKSLNDIIQDEIDEGKKEQEETVLQDTDSVMNGASAIVDDTTDETTVSSFTTDAITNPPAKETQPDTSTAS